MFVGFLFSVFSAKPQDAILRERGIWFKEGRNNSYKHAFNSVTFLSPKSVSWSGFNFSPTFLISKI